MSVSYRAAAGVGLQWMRDFPVRPARIPSEAPHDRLWALVASTPMPVASALHLRGEFYMSRMNSKRKRRSKAVPVLGAAGLSLTLASEGSPATTAPPLDTMTRNVVREITLREAEAWTSAWRHSTSSTKKVQEPSGPARDPSPLARAVACSHVWPGKPRPKTMPIRLGRHVRLGWCTSPFGKSADRLGRKALLN